MQEKEKIKVYVKVVRGKTVCLCLCAKKGCAQPCERDVVTRDKFAGWQSTMERSRFG